MPFLRKYGTGTGADVIVPMIVAGGTDHAVSADWTPASGDVKVSKDGGAAANIGTLPSYITSVGWKFVFSDAELQCARLSVQVTDSATKAVEDQHFEVETYGNASAQHAFDLDTTLTAASIVDEWESQSQADPTGFHVNVLEVGGTSQTAGDLSAQIDAVDNFVDTEIASIQSDTAGIATILTTLGTGGDGLTAITGVLGTPSDLGSGATLADMLADMAGATFSTSTDSLEALRGRGDSAWITAVGFSTHSEDDVWTVATRVLTANTNLNDPTAAAIADAVCDEALSGHTTAGTLAKALADILEDSGTTIPGILGSPAGASLAADIAANQADLDALLADLTDGTVVVGSIATGAVDADALATDAVNEIRNAITGYAGSLDTDANGRVRSVVGTGTGEFSLTSGLIDGIAGTLQTLDALDTAQDTQHGITQAAIDALNDISSADVGTAVETTLSTTTRSMPGQATPSSTPTIVEAIMQRFQLDTNPIDQDGSLQRVYNRAGNTVHQKRSVSDSGSTSTLGALATGP